MFGESKDVEIQLELSPVDSFIGLLVVHVFYSKLSRDSIPIEMKKSLILGQGPSHFNTLLPLFLFFRNSAVRCSIHNNTEDALECENGSHLIAVRNFVIDCKSSRSTVIVNWDVIYPGIQILAKNVHLMVKME